MFHLYSFLSLSTPCLSQSSSFSSDRFFIFSRFLAFLICHYFHSHNFSHIFCCFYCNFNPIFDSIFIFLFCRVCIRCLSKLMLNLILILEPVIQQLSSKLISNLSVEPAIHRGRLHSWVHDGPCFKVAESSNCQILSTMNESSLLKLLVSAASSYSTKLIREPQQSEIVKLPPLGSW